MAEKVLFWSILLTHIIVSLARDNSDNNLSNHEMNSSLKHPLSFVNDLSELPLEELLKVKKSLHELRQTNFPEDGGDNHEAHEESLESRMIDRGNFFNSNLQERNYGNGVAALTGDKEFRRKTGYGEMDNPWDSKPSKISTFFSISVTALAFLAFAGYLLCMIVQAIKNKGTMYVYPNSGNYGNTLSAMNAMTNTGSIPLIKYAKPPRGRKRRNIFLASDNQNETISSVYQQAMATPDPAEMYNVMIQCAEGYTKFYFIQ